MRELAQLLLPSVRWDPARGFGPARSAALRALQNGIGGFVIEGGPRDDVAALSEEIRGNADASPIIAVAPSTLTSAEWNARPLPLAPLGAIVSLRDLIAVRRAARAVAREALRAGCNTILSPCCDVPGAPDADAFSGEAGEVAVAAAEWIDAAQSEGILCFAGEFPGVGRVERSTGRPRVVRGPDDALYASDLVPFRAAIDAGVAGLLVADACYPALDPTGTSAMRSRPILDRLLRRQLGFEGIAAADASAMTTSGTRVGAAELVSAGIDVVLRPDNVDTELRALLDALESRRLDRERVHDAARRARARAEMAGSSVMPHDASDGDEAWLEEVAERAISVVRGHNVRIASPIEVATAGAPARHTDALVAAFAAGVGEAGGDSSGVRHVLVPAGARTALVLVVIPGQTGQDRARDTCIAASRMARDVAVVWCGHPAVAPPMPDASLVIACWSATVPMLRAAGRWLVRRV